ncbi:MAG: NADH-quinone oxidoreductase subunit B [Candidatus Baldrarchaeia archaeon]
MSENVSSSSKRTNFLGLIKRIYRSVIGWGWKYSLWPIHFVTGCCCPEFMQVAGPRYDMERFGMLPMAGARQADVMVIIGVLTRKMAKRVKMLWEQMPEPKFSVAIGACPIGKGPFYDSYSVVRADEIIPIDVYIPGCPPRPETMLQGFMLLQKKVQKKLMEGI